jgi:plasmid stabilization system protein ParE
VKRLSVVALDAVRDDVQAAYYYFEARARGAGGRFLEHYFKTADRIALNPETFPVKFDDYRRALIPKSYLAAYYFIESERAVVVAVVDARRHPRVIRNLVRKRK